ncbi:DNA-binding response regulator [Labrys miyagiensis]
MKISIDQQFPAEEPAAFEKASLSIIAGDTFGRDCFVRCLMHAYPGLRVRGYESVEDWTRDSVSGRGDTIISICRGGGAVYGFLRAGVASIRSRDSEARILLISDFVSPRIVLDATQAMLDGYVSMHNDFDVVASAIKVVASGGSLFSIGSPGPQGVAREVADLTSREMDIVYALGEGHTNREVAAKLVMAEATVKVHVRNIMRKLKVKTRIQVVRRASELFKLAQDQ